MATNLTSKGQVTIPKKIRDHLGLKPGQKIAFELAEDGQVYVAQQRLKGAVAPKGLDLRRYKKVRGLLKGGLSTDEIMRLTRGDG